MKKTKKQINTKKQARKQTGAKRMKRQGITAIILAGGLSTRCHPLTISKPKPLLPIANIPLIQHTLQALEGIADNVVIVVHFEKDKIIGFVESLKPKLHSLNIDFAIQGSALGSAHALLSAKSKISASKISANPVDTADNKLLVLNGDDLYDKHDLVMLAKYPCAVLVSRISQNAGRFGIVESKNGLMANLIEKPTVANGATGGNFDANFDANTSVDANTSGAYSAYAYTGASVLPYEIFSILSKLSRSERGEIELTDALKLMSKQQKVIVMECKGHWIPIAYPWDLLTANKAILGTLENSGSPGTISGRDKNSNREVSALYSSVIKTITNNNSEINNNKGKTNKNSFKIIKSKQGPKQNCIIMARSAVIEKGAVLKGTIVLGANTRILSGSYIEGPVVIGNDCVIGPNCYIRSYTSIGSKCHIGQAVEIKASIVMSNSNIAHLSYVGDSVIGEHVNFGAGTIVANLRHDSGNVKSTVKGALIDTGLRKLGVVVGDGAKTGIHTSLYPGRKLWPNTRTLPGQIVDKDVER